MKREIKEIALNAGIGGLGESQIDKFSKAIAKRCVDIFEKYDPKYAIKTIKQEFELEEDKQSL